MDVLDGKAVLITGAGRGLGRAYALHAAAAGAMVLVNDVRGDLAEEVAGQIREAGGRAVADGSSVADPEEASALVEECVTRFGALDGLVNNAAVGHHLPPWRDDPARIRAVIEVNVLGSMYCGTAAARVMHARGRGVIVNVGSGSMLGQRGAAAYSASKGAVASMTASWAADLAEHGIRVNAVCPLAWTPLMEQDPNAHRLSSPEQTPERIAPLVTYLLSDRSAGITGQLIRFVGDKLMIVRQPALKEPVLAHEEWTVEEVAAAFDGELAGALEPPPAQRWAL
ncbi:SDR family NAD(P)-dependent oxidoreductase [Amycolatopsis aidingensis]|uniref:SDR family NAD(P)-dependent oxidoreductase n=1 Tax=Amycolatopsis aidingensis TaxID=2842453 RepID=UPI001C0C75B0|nr:SDR family oxidoreductase [Amycolatopsis aidingensis]